MEEKSAMRKLLQWWLCKPPVKENHMNHFSQEFLDKLIAEHRLVSASILHLTGGTPNSAYTRFARAHGPDAVDQARKNLYAKKVELEAQIDVLKDYLN